MGFLQEMKLAQGIHTPHGAGYDIREMERESRYWGGVAVVCRAANWWQVEGTASFGPNMASFLLTSRARRWCVIGVYMLLNYVSAVHHVDQMLRAAPKVLELMLIRELDGGI